MTHSDKGRSETDKDPGEPGVAGRKTKQPGWADGLRKLYDSVVDEPLPDSFDDLLKKLDQADDA